MNTIITALNEAKEKDTASKQPLFAVFNDIKERNEVNRHNFDANQIRKAERINIVADWAYPHNRTFITFRKKFISVKVEDVQIADAIPVHLNTLTEMVSNDPSITVTTNGNNLLFRITR